MPFGINFRGVLDCSGFHTTNRTNLSWHARELVISFQLHDHNKLYCRSNQSQHGVLRKYIGARSTIKHILQFFVNYRVKNGGLKILQI